MARHAASPVRDRADDSLFTLLGDLPELVKNLIRAELGAVKTYVGKLVKHGGWTAIMAVAALFFLFWTIPAFLAFLIILLDLWMPLWASALIVLGIGVVMIVACAAYAYLVHVRAIKRLESPGAAAKADAAIVKEFADEF
ncbi:phage holin family protein [Microbacterium sp. ZXX196]|uniref:phage holin family protein n=1 Tax=Microbacterium sp. ZXX196 TaxID=2609291 RepID=UPI0012B6F999|nr:phage holin family protein [Microbacterium sp. ZXX196]MTE24695.1 phage holin family protein [Microbacterium sp. ZXX196]